MSVANVNNTGTVAVGASLFVPAPARDLYEALLDVEGFPNWVPLVRRVEILEGPRGPGMISEWEVSVLGMRRAIPSVLVEAEPHGFLKWTYEGPVTGHGECAMEDLGNGTLARFGTEISPEDPVLARFMRAAPARSAAQSHLKRCLARLGRKVCGNDAVRVGPLTGL